MKARRLAIAACAAALLLSCEKPSARKPARAPKPPASASAALAGIADDFWKELLRNAPQWATAVGERERDAELDDLSSKEARRHADALFALRVRLDAVEPTKLGESERVTAEALREELTGRIEAAQACRAHLWAVDPLSGPQVELAQLATHHGIRTKHDAETLIARYRAAGAQLDAHIAALREGLGEGLVAPRIVVERLVTQLDAQLAAPARESPHAKAKLPETEGWHAEEAVRVRERLVKAVEESVYPALGRYRDFARDELLPRSRAVPGVSDLPGGAACYVARIRLETGTQRTAQGIHDRGLAQVAKIEEEMLAIARAHGRAGIADYQAALDGSAESFFGTREEIVAHNEAVIAKAREALPKAFRVLPRTALEVRPVEAYREKDASRGSYHPAPADGTRPAIYFANTLDPRTQRRWSIAALAAHEALPGHHLQIALAQETTGLPRFQREIPPTVYVEGWALYAERLADELGLYADDAERFGMLDAQRLRAVRLVVDTGLHALGWSRERAVEYQLAHGALTRTQAERAIDRYITWPGQALAYMTGQLELEAMRADAEKVLGPKFDLREFHDRVLRHGGVPLPAVRREIDAWIASARPR